MPGTFPVLMAIRFQVLMARIRLLGAAAEDGLVVGFAAPPDHAYHAALEALCRILPSER
ncbi:hypothetical protein GCM10009760_46820 [Kitasatospora kazusensis]|uniref:Uncharacterized protein n=1 Tax=Kitasatospora kazusensis TaxID=407974 RepID=A0ABP5LT62_9ACTN